MRASGGGGITTQLWVERGLPKSANHENHTTNFYKGRKPSLKSTNHAYHSKPHRKRKPDANRTQTEGPKKSEDMV
jgi:hypothetical protein